METLKAITAFIFGSALYVFFLGLAVFSIPLNVIAIMHLWGYEWWSALLLSMVIGCVPLLGQLAYIVLAVMGAYFFYQADFSWREATQPSIKTFEISTLSNSQFEEYKKSKIYPELFDSCMREGKERYGLDGRVPKNVSARCECYAEVVVAAISKKDFSEKTKPVGFEDRVKSAFVTKCTN